MTLPLCVENLTKRFRQGQVVIEALRQVRLQVQQGEFVAVMGPSGSGKSTLLHLLAGLTRPDEGRILVEGQDLARLSDYQRTVFRRRRIGLVFQAFNLVPTLTAEENILLPALADGRSRRELADRLEMLLGAMQLQERRRHRPDALSGGEQQRVAIARALIGEPAILLADEPTGNLDTMTGQHLCLLLHQLSKQQGRTVLLVTHEPTVAVWADRIVVLKDGQIVHEFAPSESRDPQRLAVRYQEIVGVPAPAAV
jgi:putative ABC transport system ATP-binding protein